MKEVVAIYVASFFIAVTVVGITYIKVHIVLRKAKEERQNFERAIYATKLKNLEDWNGRSFPPVAKNHHLGDVNGSFLD